MEDRMFCKMIMRRFVLAVAPLLLVSPLLAQSPPILPGEIPDPVKTPGKTAPTKQPRDVPPAVKLQVWHLYGYDATIGPYNLHSADYEIDHLIPLGLNGTNDIENLWPQPRKGNWTAAMKDHREHRIEDKFKQGGIALKGAQGMFTPDWTKAYKAEGLPEKKKIKEPAINVYFSSQEDCEAMILHAIEHAEEKTIRVQACYFTSVPIANALINASKNSGVPDLRAAPARCPRANRPR
jgi:hypothetical protein